LFEARIYISLKKGILDLEGKTVKHGLKSLGYDQVEDVKTAPNSLTTTPAIVRTMAPRKKDSGFILTPCLSCPLSLNAY
jgi:hypothetical protein